MKTFLPFFKSKKLQAFLAPVLKLAEATFELLVPIFVAQIIDNGIPNSDINYIVMRCVILVALGVGGLAFTVVSQYMSASVATSFAANLRLGLFDKINSASFSSVDEMGQSAIVTRMTGDVDRLQTGVNMTLRLLMRAPFIVFGAMVAAFLVDAVSATVFAVCIPVLAVVVSVILLAGVRTYKKTQDALEKITLLTEENATGVRVLRAFAKEDDEVKRFEEVNGKYTKIQLFAGRISALLNPLTYAIINVAIICLLYFGGLRIDGGSLTKGQLVALYNYLSQILVELIKLANLVITVARALASGKRVENMQILPEKQEFTTDILPEIQTDFAVRFENVSLSYGGKQALNNVSFELKKGETLGVLGGTGSGKSSLVSLIPRFYDATEGKVFVDGADVKDYPKKQLRDKVAVVMQKPFLSTGNIKDNICFGDYDEEKMKTALRVSQSEDIISAKENGLDEEVKKSGANFSGGQKQRLSIARAIYKNAEILILDDAASALDTLTESKLKKELSALNKTTIIVSQRVNGLKHADKIIVLDEGNVVSIGKHEDLLLTCPLYKEIYDLQNSGGEVLQ